MKATSLGRGLVLRQIQDVLYGVEIPTDDTSAPYGAKLASSNFGFQRNRNAFIVIGCVGATLPSAHSGSHEGRGVRVAPQKLPFFVSRTPTRFAPMGLTLIRSPRVVHPGPASSAQVTPAVSK